MSTMPIYGVLWGAAARADWIPSAIRSIAWLAFAAPLRADMAVLEADITEEILRLIPDAKCYPNAA